MRKYCFDIFLNLRIIRSKQIIALIQLLTLLHPYSSEFRIFIKPHYKQVVFFMFINSVFMHDIWHWGVCRQRNTYLINGIFNLNTNDPRPNIPFGKLAVARKVYHSLRSIVFLQNLLTSLLSRLEIVGAEKARI